MSNSTTKPPVKIINASKATTPTKVAPPPQQPQQNPPVKGLVKNRVLIPKKISMIGGDSLIDIYNKVKRFPFEVMFDKDKVKVLNGVIVKGKPSFQFINSKGVVKTFLTSTVLEPRFKLIDDNIETLVRTDRKTKVRGEHKCVCDFYEVVLKIGCQCGGN